ncbi:MAG: hypothetical protein R3C61_24685 [Bacteroidia bacterium]
MRERKNFLTYFNTTIRDYISAIQAHHTLLIVDSCFSGSLLHRDAEVFKIKALADKVDRLPSRWGLAAGLVELVSDGPIGVPAHLPKVC